LIPRLLPTVSENQEGSAQDVKQGEIMKDNVEFTEHFFSNYLAAKTILNSAEKYAKVSQQKVPLHKISSVRDDFIRELKWD